MDDGFTSLEQGAKVYGVGDGVLPNVYEPGRKPTNFDQLLDIADSRTFHSSPSTSAAWERLLDPT